MFQIDLWLVLNRFKASYVMSFGFSVFGYYYFVLQQLYVVEMVIFSET